MSKVKKKILIIEDDLALQRALQEKFQSKDFVVFTANDGEAGLELALAKHPDITLLDLLLPKIDGMTALKRLRADSWGKHAKVIVLTNLNDKAKVAEGLESGMDGSYDYLVKTDWSLDEVVKKVKGKLEM